MKMRIAELHDKLFDVLCIVDDICRNAHVRYFLDGGTELGAVREHDFIAWDDDMDIKVLREDYSAFKAAMEKSLPPYMHIVEPQVFAPAFYDFVVRIYDERYLLRPETEEEQYYSNYHNHPGTDVFIFDRMPASASRRSWTVFKMKCLYGMGMGHRYRINWSAYSGIMKAQMGILATIGKAFSVETLCRWYDKTSGAFAGDDTAPYRMSSNGPLGKVMYPQREWFDGEADGYIRGRRFPVAQGYDGWMTMHYGDYMKPPKDKSIYVQHLKSEEAEA